MIYWALLIFSFAFFMAVQFGTTTSPVLQFNSVEENKKIKTYFIFTTIFMIILVGFRDLTVGIDTDGYYKAYVSNATRNFGDIFKDNVKEKAYLFIQIFCNKLGIGYVGFNVIYAVFNFYVVSLLIYKYSKMPWLSYFIYFCFSFYALSFTMVRQTWAMSIVVLAVINDKNQGFWSFVKFALVVYIASLFHTSAIVAIPLWFVRKLKFNKYLTICIFGMAFFTLIFKSQFADFVINYAGRISDKYESYSDVQSGNAGMLLYMMIIVSIAFGFMLKNFLLEEDNAFFFYCLCIMIIIFPAVQGGGAIMRIYYYFYIYMIVYIPNMLESIRKEEHFYIKLFILMLYIGVGLYCYRSNLLHNTYGIMPYKFYLGGNY